MKRGLESLHDDEDFQAINKPAGYSTVSERWQHELPTVVELLWKEWQQSAADSPKPHIVHRLDKETSGVLLFARHRDAQAALRKQFQERQVAKQYLAMVRGLPEPSKGTIELNIDEDPRKPGRMVAVKKGKECSTEYEVVEVFRDVTLIRLRPKQGRTHQIRISLQSIGHPCAVDPVYGDGKGLYLSRWKRDYSPRKGHPERPLMGRLALHAEQLTFAHPTTGAPTTIEAPLPKDFRALLKQLRRWSQ